MGKTVTQKILESHLVDGDYIPGKEIGIKIDQTLTQDATGTMAYLQFETMGIPRVKTDLSVSYIDHNTLQLGFENADDHKYLQTVASKYGIKLSRAGNGICHQVHLERFAEPGKTLLGSDSHTPTGGGVGMIAMGAGGLDVAVAMGGGPFYLTAPKVIGVKLTGKLPDWTSAKDIVLKVLEILTTKGNVGCVLEYFGTGIKTLTVPERGTITNMGAETGVTCSVFPSDEITKEFLKAQEREEQWTSLEADQDAEYDKIIEINLSEIEPMAAAPHSPGNVKPISAFEGMDVDQVMVGSCTNSSYVDLMTVAKILKGKRVQKDMSFGVAPGSRQVMKMISKNGALADIIDSGARILESTCGFCIGAGQAPTTNAVSLRTNNRNFKGRSGTKSADVYLVSPASAAAAALTGKVTDPRKLEDMGISFPGVEMPDEFLIDDSLIRVPEDNPDSVEIIKGPNIQDCPKNEGIPDNIKGEVTIKVRDKITTDHIMPAGIYLKYRSNVPKYSQFVFEPVDDTFHDRASKIRDQGQHNIIVAGLSYGQGSSREHAALCPMYLGVKTVIAKSVERIHDANLANFGIVALNFENDEDYEKIKQGDKLSIPGIRDKLLNKKQIVVVNETKGIEIPVRHNLSERRIGILASGGLLNYTVK